MDNADEAHQATLAKLASAIDDFPTLPQMDEMLWEMAQLKATPTNRLMLDRLLDMRSVIATLA